LAIDERALDHLVEESEDHQADSLRQAESTLPDLADIAEERRGQEVNGEEIGRYNAGRRQLLQRLGLGAGGLAAGSLFGGAFGSVLAAVVAAPARADTALDLQILQTASSLEVLAINTYHLAMTLPAMQTSPRAVIDFAAITRKQHDEHRKAFQAQTLALGGKEQNEPNPVFDQVVRQEATKLKAAVDVVTMLKTLETVTTQTYLANVAVLEDSATKRIMASVMGVETQHAAVLSAVEELLRADVPDLVQVPFPQARISALPSEAGRAGFPENFETPSQIAPPESGAVK
jgi:hypothetical protein